MKFMRWEESAGRDRLRRATLIGALVLGLGALAAPAAAAVGAAPSLRLFAVVHRVTMGQRDLRFGAADLGLWVTSVGGGFQIDVRRPGYGAWTASQVDPATGASLRPVPVAMVDPGGGLTRFLNVRFFDSRGRLAAHRLLTFCPNGESARVNDTGPQNQTYQGDCASAMSFPFVRGIVWGIDSGWAVSPSLTPFGGFFPPGLGGPLPPGLLPPRRPPPGGFNLKPGRYTARVTITLPYIRLFGIAAQGASATVSVQVFHQRPFHFRPPRPPTRPDDDHPPAPPVAAGPQAAAIVAHPDPATLPNLVATPAWQIGIHRFGRRDLLTFNATIWNAGPASFSIEGFRRPNSGVMNAYEYFFDSSGNVVGRAPAGTLFYDNGRGHHHWHLRQLAAYVLIGPSGKAILSQKQSFCIAPTNAVDLTVPGAAPGATLLGGLGFGSACDFFSPGSIWIREQLPAGWGDTYSQSVAGQAFDITNMPNGRYRIEVQVNPLGVLSETTTADNVAVRSIRLSGHRGARTVRSAPWHGISG